MRKLSKRFFRLCAIMDGDNRHVKTPIMRVGKDFTYVDADCFVTSDFEKRTLKLFKMVQAVFKTGDEIILGASTVGMKNMVFEPLMGMEYNICTSEVYIHFYDAVRTDVKDTHFGNTVRETDSYCVINLHSQDIQRVGYADKYLKSLGISIEMIYGTIFHSKIGNLLELVNTTYLPNYNHLKGTPMSRVRLGHDTSKNLIGVFEKARMEFLPPNFRFDYVPFTLDEQNDLAMLLCAVNVVISRFERYFPEEIAYIKARGIWINLLKNLDNSNEVACFLSPFMRIDIAYDKDKDGLRYSGGIVYRNTSDYMLSVFVHEFAHLVDLVSCLLRGRSISTGISKELIVKNMGVARETIKYAKYTGVTEKGYLAYLGKPTEVFARLVTVVIIKDFLINDVQTVENCIKYGMVQTHLPAQESEAYLLQLLAHRVRI